MLRLPELVGSPLSTNALREDLQVSQKTVASWLQLLERLFAIFRLAPFGAPRIRAVTEKRKPIRFIECKLGDRDIDPGLKYLARRFPQAEAWQISLGCLPIHRR